MNTCTRLKELLNSGTTLVVPDAYDPISARIIEQCGFMAVQCSGGSYSISRGYKSEADISYQDNLEQTRQIVQAVNIPVMADGEDGYGDAEVINKTIRDFIAAGTAGINIEDQIISREGPTRIIERQAMIEKIIAAKEAKRAAGSPDFIINARTDALKVSADRSANSKEAIERANHYLAAGADLVFVAYADTLEEVALLQKEIQGPLSIAAGLPYNIRAFSINDLIGLNLARISLPMIMIQSSIQGMLKSLATIKESNSFQEILDNGLVCTNEDLAIVQNRVSINVKAILSK
ncbi:MAG: isocitrate lyase/PEP mutase family protein [Syntrophomonas sp.]